MVSRCSSLVLALPGLLVAQQGVWSRIPGDPAPPRWTIGMLAYDQARRLCVHVNGSDVWESDGTSWRFVASVPNTGGFGFAFAWDGTRQRCLLFGGQLPFGNTLSEWDGAAWRFVSTANAPPVRSNSAMAYDTRRARLVLFGGWSALGNLNDTWEFDGIDWQQALPTASPPAMRLHRMAYDSARAETLVYSGSNPTGSWLYDGTTWRPTPVAAPALSPSALAYDERRARTVLVGSIGLGATSSATWEWDGSTWTNRQPNGPLFPPSGVGAYDGGRGAVVVPASGFDGISTWAWNGTQWQRQTPFGAIPVLAGVATAWHPAANAALAFGGTSGARTGTNETLQYRSGGWRLLAPANRPPVRGHAGLAVDPATGDLLLMGGLAASAFGDTWRWNGSDWTQLAPATSPSPRGQHAMATDAARGRIVLFGGQDAQNVPFGDTWEWDGVNWSQASPLHAPLPRPAAAMAYDAARGRTLLFGGGSAALGFRDDHWQWDGVDWTQRVLAVRPAPRAYGRLAFDPRSNQVVLAGGFVYHPLGVNVAVADTWLWDDVQWTSVTGSAPVYNADGVGVYHGELGGLLYSAPLGLLIQPSDHLFRFGSVASVSVYGAGCPGGTGIPELSAISTPLLGNAQFGLWVARARADALVVVGLDWQSAAIPLGGGCQALVQAPVLVTGVANALGGAVVPLAIPNAPALRGLALHGQAATLDPAGALAGVAALTAGLRLGLN